MGIEQRLQLEPQVKGNAYEQDFPDHLALPETLERAAGKLARSQVAQDLFGKAFVEHYVASRLWEAQEFRKHITDWELKRYFEII